LLDWRWAEERLEQAKTYWLATVRPDGRPHVVPLWGVWVDNGFYFGGAGVKVRNLAQNANAAIHLESGDEVVIVEGACELVTPSQELSARLKKASVVKYGFGGSGEGEPEPVYVLRAKVVLGWSHLPRDATRWRFDAEPRAEGSRN
jgi:hypothetical protein